MGTGLGEVVLSVTWLLGAPLPVEVVAFMLNLK